MQKRPLRNSRGMNTSAAYLFTRSLMKALRLVEPTHAAVAFDARAKTFRHAIFQEYKAERPAMPDDLGLQMPYIRDIASALGLIVILQEGFEADDIIATLAKEAKGAGWECVILTSDKDMLQLVGDGVVVLDTRPEQEVLYDREAVVEKLGVEPEMIPDYMALMGDKIDGVPGVKGIGAKSAAQLVKKHGGLKNILENLDQLEPRFAKLIRGDIENAKMSLELVKLATVPGLPKLSQLRLAQPDRPRLLKIFRELGFNSLIKEFSAPYESQFPISVGRARPEGPAVAAPWKEGIMWAAEPDRAFVCSWQEAEDFLSGDIQKACFYSKKLHKAAMRQGISVKGVEFDLVIADYLLDPGAISQSGRYKEDLDHFAPKYMGLVPSKDPETRTAQELHLALTVKETVVGKLKQDGLDSLFRQVELPLTRVLARMELAGIKLDIDYLKTLDQELQAQIESLLTRINETAGFAFNVNSPKQLSYVLFDLLKLPKLKKTKTGYSTDQSVLEELAKVHPLPGLIIEYRELFKLRSTYTQALLEMADPRTHRVHPTFHQTGTATGRISCSDPNLQNIPIRTEIGKRIRRAFVADQGKVLVDADYSQIELRVIAHVSKDRNLVQAFEQGLDIHAATASKILDKPLDQITQEDRRIAKMINFGLAYGMSSYGLASRLDIPEEQARQFMESYFENFPGISQWMDKIVEQALEKGYVETIMGRRRYIPGISSSSKQTSQAARRAAINAPFQGSAADIIKKAMVDIDKALPGAVPLLQIHDELIYEVPEENAEETARSIKQLMESAVHLNVPLVAEVSVGKNWLEAGK